MQLSATECPACASRASDVVTGIPHDIPDGRPLLSVRVCRACGLAWQYPRLLSADESVQAHLQKYSMQREGSYFDPQWRREVVGIELGFLETFHITPGELLDIGAGDGAFIVRAAERGWQCVGVDPAARLDPTFAAACPQNVELIRGTLDSLRPTRRFDVITLWDVIEHLEDPQTLLRSALHYLKDDGILVLETGNFESVDRIIAGPDWWAYAADHRWYFAPPNLARMLRRAGFGHVALASRVLRPGWHGNATYRGPSLLRTLKKLARAPFHATKTVAQHKHLRAAATYWAQWAGLGIICMMGSRTPIKNVERSTRLIRM